ncbi:MAG: 2-oxo acid dehydrogenase subunit E2 [Myxococcales bacterium]|nr:2-oxo acid dehydrogenase subunit E2 [Myxococcales bacterium]MCB9714075.1 2-oxo acid dehydrogenase subunit E2 [Myxococcales bacterium]
MKTMTTRRKLAIATWRAPREGNIYGRLALDTEQVQRYLSWLSETTGTKVTLTAFVGACVARGLAATPTLNGRIFLGRYIPHSTVAVSFLVALEDGGDLGKVKVDRADEAGPQGIAEALRAGAGTLRKGKDEAFNKSKGVIRMLPTWLLRPMLRWVGWLGSCGGFSIPALGVEPYPFGTAIVTSVGMLGIDEGLVPPTPFAHVPLYVCVGNERRVPTEWHGEIALRPQVVITATIDHRFIDGFQLGTLARLMRELFANPWAFSGLEGPPDALEAPAPEISAEAAHA